MSIVDGLLVSAFGLATVFIVLIALSGAVSLESKIFSMLNNKKNAKLTVDVSETPEKVQVTNSIVGPTNQLKLIDVDEKTAALVMAIVSDESQIPLSELNFKYIKAVD